MYLTLGSYANQGSFLVSNASENGWAVEIANVSLPRFFTWEHYAVARVGNVWTVYKNGVSAGTTTVSASVPASKGPFAIGTQESGGQYWPGYISAFRVVKGVSLYNGNFVPPTAPPTAVPNTILLLNFTNAAVADLTGRNQLESVGNVQSSRTQAKWNYLTTGAALYFDGTGDYLYQPYSQLLNLFNGNFTVESWIYPTATNTRMIFAGAASAAGDDNWFWQITAGNKLQFNWTNTTPTGFSATSTASISPNTWTYIAVVKNGGTITQYINGSADGTSSPTGTYRNLSNGFGIGRAGDYNGLYYTGYISSFRITASARYTGATITVPSGPFKTR
jgi:hypothetical protein